VLPQSWLEKRREEDEGWKIKEEVLHKKCRIAGWLIETLDFVKTGAPAMKIKIKADNQ
jgi:hypothetical protein